MALLSNHRGLGVDALSEVVLKAVPLDVVDQFLARAFACSSCLTSPLEMVLSVSGMSQRCKLKKL